MGWLFTQNQSRRELIRKLTTPEHNERRTWRTVVHCLRGNRLWAVVEVVDNQEIRPESYIALYLLQYHRGCRGWGYKEMEESMHPYYYDCPPGYLEMAPVACEAWRAEVRAYHARMSRRFEVGQTVALIGSRIPWVRITQLKPLRGQYQGVVYRVRRDRLGELLTEATL